MARYSYTQCTYTITSTHSHSYAAKMSRSCWFVCMPTIKTEPVRVPIGKRMHTNVHSQYRFKETSNERENYLELILWLEMNENRRKIRFFSRHKFVSFLLSFFPNQRETNIVETNFTPYLMLFTEGARSAIVYMLTVHCVPHLCECE